MMWIWQGTVATTVCSPADVLKSRIMNASGPGSSVRLLVSTYPDHILTGILHAVDDWRNPSVARERGADVHVQRVATRMDTSPADNHSHLPDTRTVEAFG